MLARLIAATFASLFVPLTTAVQNGPSSLYSLLNGMTFNPSGYTIVMYQSCVQNQNAGNPCGSFSGFQSSNGQYTHMLYGPEAPVSSTCSRTFKLALACGPTLAMSGVNENPTCVYSATLSMPQVCGVDLTVGNEASSVSPTALPPTSSPTTTLTLTATPTVTTSTTTTLTATPTTTLTATSTPLFQITAWPTTTATSTLTATSTPLFMITAWPSPSPVNVSATPTPLYYYTAYPTVGSNATGGGGLLGLAASLTGGSSSTAVILGSVALGIVGLGAAAGGVAYFRKGGSVSGLMDKINSGKGTLTQLANALPISEAQKAKLTGAIADPSSLLPEQAQSAIHQVQGQAQAVLHQVQEKAQAAIGKAEALKEQAHAIQSQVLQVLPPSVGAAILAKEAALTQHVQGLAQQAQAQVLQALPPVIAEQVLQVLPPVIAEQAQVPIEQKEETVLTFAPVPVQTDVAHIAVSADQVEAIRAFLEQKAAEEKK